MDPARINQGSGWVETARDRFRIQCRESMQLSSRSHFVQVDHTLVDVIVVDRQYRRPLQKAWLTLAIDVASRKGGGGGAWWEGGLGRGGVGCGLLSHARGALELSVALANPAHCAAQGGMARGAEH